MNLIRNCINYKKRAYIANFEILYTIVIGVVNKNVNVDEISFYVWHWPIFVFANNSVQIVILGKNVTVLILQLKFNY